MESAGSLSPGQPIADAFPGPSKPPGFSKRELQILALVLALIALWGFTGIDRTGFDDAAPARPGEPQRSPVAAAIPGDDVDALSDRGRQVFEANGCYACHSIDGSKKIGPTLLGSWGRSEAMADGSTLVVDEKYFYESVMEPQAHIVEGFEEAAMPSYEGLIDGDDLEALAQYVRSLK